jgi:hypothetical protein
VRRKATPTFSTRLKGGKITTAAYVVTAKIKNGEARIKTRLIQSPAGEWQFLQFYVDSPVFLQ